MEIKNGLHVARKENLDEIRAAYIDLIENTPGMDKCTQWVYGKRPCDELILDYIQKGEMYIQYENDEIAGMMSVTMGQGENYHQISWNGNFLDDEVCVIHLLAVTPAFQKNGIGRKLMTSAFELAKKQGIKAVRLDVLVENIPAQKMYEKLGFTNCCHEKMFVENSGILDFYFLEKIL